MSTFDEYPEHAKRSKIIKDSQIVGEFLDWLGAQGVHLMTYGKRVSDEPCTGTMFRQCEDGLDESGRQCVNCGGTGYAETTREGYWDWTPSTIEERLAAYFDIDLKKIEQERRQMLKALTDAAG